ncbi:MAG: tetratricopeptide repeat protein [Chloroflexota bacterium]
MPEHVLGFGPPENDAHPLTFDGAPVGVFTPPADAPSRAALLTLLRAGPFDPGSQAALDDLLREWGLALTRALFVANPELTARYEALPAADPLVLAFAPEALPLADVPWEVAWELATRTPLAAARPLARRLLGDDLCPPDFAPLDRAPRLLVVIAEPAALGRFGARRAHDLLRDQIQPLVDQGRLAADFLPPPVTPEALDDALRQRRYDLLHIVAHGAPTGLALEGDDGRARDVGAVQWRARLRGKGLRLAVLTSCLTASVGGAGAGLSLDEGAGSAPTGLTRALLQAGLPLVVAMQFPAQVEAALRFAGALYATLAGERGADLLAALHDARQGGFFTQGTGSYEWSVPVVYAQAADVPLFPDSPAADRVELRGWPAPTPTHTPDYRAPFVGRGAELAELLAALGTDRAVALTGSGGIGKTELVKAACFYLADRGRYAPAIAWADLETAHTRPLVLQGIAAALGLALDPRVEPLEALCAALGDWPGLLVLDNLETALDSAHAYEGGDAVRAALAALLERCAAHVLITSRSVVGIGEREVRLGTMASAEGLRLFLAAADRADYRRHEGDEAALGDIVALLDNYPLALALAATHLRDDPPAALLERLRTEQAAVLRNPAFRQHTRLTSFYTSMGLSVGRLSADARRLFESLAVLEGGAFGFSLEAVYGPGWREPLGELLRRSLAVADEGWEERYTLLAPVRGYAETTAGPDTLAGARRRAAEHYRDVARESNAMLSGPQAVLATGVLALELANLRAGIRWAAARAAAQDAPPEEARRASELLVSYAFDLGPFLMQQGYWQERVDLQEQGARAAAALGRARDAAGLKGNLATVLQDMGRVTEANKLYQEVEEDFRRLGGKDYATLLHQQGLAAQAQGDYPAARRLYGQSLEMAQQLGDRAGVATSLHELGVLAQATGDYPEARRLYQASLEILQQLGDRAGVATSLHELGRLAQATGDYPEARRLYGQSLEIEQQLGDRAGVAASLHQLGNLAYLQGDYPEARRLYGQSLEIKQQLGNRAGVAQTLHQLGNLAYLQGDYPEARRLYEQAAATFAELGARREQAAVLHQLGMLAQDTGEVAEARRLYGQSLEIEQQLGNKQGIAESLGQLGRLAEVEGRLEEAVPLWLAAAAIFQALGSPNLQTVQRWLARARATLGEARFQELTRQALR